MNRLIIGDCRAALRDLARGGVKVQCVVTSPPYWGLRDYGHPGQLGLEPTPEEYVANMVAVFRLVRDVLADDGVLWLNLGDSYAGSGRGGNPTEETSTLQGGQESQRASMISRRRGSQLHAGLHESARVAGNIGRVWVPPPAGLKQKDLVGIPWMVAFALRADGWYLRQDIIWSKPNPMPESVTDRCTKAHEYIFMLTKQRRYFYDAEAIREPASEASIVRWAQNIDDQKGSERAHGGGKTNGAMKAVGGPRADKQRGHSRRHAGFNDRWDGMTKAEQSAMGRNKRSVWTVATQPYSGAHFATFPPALIEPCILAGSRPGDIVLDPFFGSGTTGQVAEKLGRKWIGIELNPDYEPLAKARTQQAGMML